MKLAKIIESFKDEPKRKYRKVKDQTLNVGSILKTRTKKHQFFLKSGGEIDFDAQYELDKYEFMDTTSRRRIVEYISYHLMKYLEKYNPHIKTPKQVRLNYDKDNDSFEVLSSAFRNLPSRFSHTSMIYQDIVRNIYLFMILIGNTDLHKGNVIIKSKDQYYMIDPEVSLQNYDKVGWGQERDVMDRQMDTFYRIYGKKLPELKHQYAIIKNINVRTEFTPIIDRCIDTALKILKKNGITRWKLKKRKWELNNMKERILVNITANRRAILVEFKEQVA